jgi:hypothetical protein
MLPCSLSSNGVCLHILLTPPACLHTSRRMVFDLVFWIFVGILCFNVLTGLIFSTFGKLRAAMYERQDILENQIFVSGISRTKYADLALTEAPSFDELAATTQNHWNYVNLLLYLRSKNPVDYTGIDTFVRGRIDEGRLDWLPSKNTFHMQLAGAKYDQPPGSGPAVTPIRGDDDNDSDSDDSDDNGDGREGKGRERRRPKGTIAGALFDFTAQVAAVQKEVGSLAKRMDLMERKKEAVARQRANTRATAAGGGGGGDGEDHLAEEAMAVLSEGVDGVTSLFGVR